MPFHLEKGPYLTILESQYNSSTEGLLEQLNHLLADGNQWDTDFYDCAEIKSGPLTKRELQDHIVNDWFGWAGSVPNYTPQGLSVECGLPPAPQQTGYWQGYHGDVEKIVRTTLIRAGQVALGVDTLVNPITLGNVRRHWPVEFFWVCGTDRFEGYVTWRCHAKPDEGQVTVVFVTPATRDLVWDDLGEVPHAPTTTTEPGPAPVIPVPAPIGSSSGVTDAMQGLWLVTHTKHVRYVVVQVSGTRYREVALPPALIPPVIPPAVRVVALSSLVVGCGAVETFKPAFFDGGAEPFGLRC